MTSDNKDCSLCMEEQEWYIQMILPNPIPLMNFDAMPPQMACRGKRLKEWKNEQMR